jgi:hypothetical protein
MEYAERIYCGITQGLGGNRCFHNPLSPNFYTPPEQHGYRPAPIQMAGNRLPSFYTDPSCCLPSLRFSRESTRQERSEARERDVMVLGAILHYTELATMRVGVPLDNGNFISLSMIDIAIKVGWRKKEDTGTKGIKRVWRSIKNLKKAGYLVVHRRWKKMLEGEQDYIGLPAVKCIAPKLFYELGIKAKELNKARKQASARLKKKYRAFREKAEAELQKITQQAMGVIAGAFKGARPKKRSNKRERNALKIMEERLRNKEHELKKRLAELMKIPINQNKSRDTLIDEYPELKELPQIEKALLRA